MFKKIIKNIVLSAVVLPVVIGSAVAAYPDKPIKMMIGYAPGSSTDIVGRMIANDLSLALKQPVIVENRGGAAGSLAADAVAKSAPDGYTILFAQNGLAINVAANPKLPFNGQKDLLPVVGVAATPHILIVNNNSKAKNVADLIAMLKADPGKLSFGSSGIGNSDHMAGELFLATTGLQAIHIPYKGGSPAATDLVGGQIDFYFAGNDKWLFDLAVTVNDWCIDLPTGEIDPVRYAGLLKQYQTVRPLTPEELASWPMMLRAAALRFWVSRLWDFFLPREAEMLTPHDPTHFERILTQRRQNIPLVNN